MKAEQGYYSSDLNIYYNTSHENAQKNREIYHSEYFMKRFKYYMNTYVMFYAIDGEYNIGIKNYNHIISGKKLIVVKPNEYFSFKPNMDKKFKFLFVCIHPKIFKNENIEDNYFRAFDFFSKENIIIDLESSTYKKLANYLDNICELITYKYGDCHIKSACLSAITRLTMIFDLSNNSEFIAKSVSVNIMNYIKKHYTEKMSYDVLKRKFSVSTPTINTIVKNETGMTFYNYITELKLQDAKQMLRKSWSVSAKDIAYLCGFNNYNSFYKAYIKKYGIPPSKESKTDTDLKYWPFSKE